MKGICEKPWKLGGSENSEEKGLYMGVLRASGISQPKQSQDGNRVSHPFTRSIQLKGDAHLVGSQAGCALGREG